MLRRLGRLYDLPLQWGVSLERWLRLRVGWRNSLLLIVAPWLAFGWAMLLGWVEYIADPRFTATYEKIAPGLAQYLRGAIKANAAGHVGD